MAIPSVQNVRLAPVTAAEIDEILKRMRGLGPPMSFSYAGCAWDKLSVEDKEALCSEYGQAIKADLFREWADLGRRNEEVKKAAEARAAAERQEFWNFAQAQFPDLIEAFRRLQAVKTQFARFAGQAPKEDPQ